MARAGVQDIAADEALTQKVGEAVSAATKAAERDINSFIAQRRQAITAEHRSIQLSKRPAWVKFLAAVFEPSDR